MAITSNAQTRERLKLKEVFLNAYQRCHSHPMDGVSFTLDDFLAAIELYDFSFEISTKVTPFFLSQLLEINMSICVE